MRSLPLKLEPGSDLRTSLEQLGRTERASGFVLGVVGNLSRAVFQCPGRRDHTVLEGILEIITLNGTISPDGVHLHLSFSDGDCQVWGGHLEPGTIVLKGADVLIGLLEKHESIGESIPSAVIQDSDSPRLEIAVLPDCPWSARALRMLRSNQVPHKIKLISSEADFENLKERSDISTFPQVFIDGKLIGGYDSLAELHGSGKLESLK